MKANPGNPFFHIIFFPESVSVPGRIWIADAHRGGPQVLLKKEHERHLPPVLHAYEK
jgi:hypothetical protein